MIEDKVLPLPEN